MPHRCVKPSRVATSSHDSNDVRSRPMSEADSMENNPKSEKLESARYEIRVRGTLSETLVEAFPRLEREVQGRETVLTGALPDQAALFGVLGQIEALGLELLELRRIPS
jgi:hypothetical protein